ncbi:MAG: hypothetical protein K8F91_09390 [Candidatus Obscuribacterales bacterium]|nr:hypothetical protein [Candidatus Obscuribacterales bacterium]
MDSRVVALTGARLWVLETAPPVARTIALKHALVGIPGKSDPPGLCAWE